MTEQSLSVLLVDDDPHTGQIFELIMNHLEHSNFVVLDNSETALDYLQLNYAELVIVDLFMPTIDGFKLLDMIREKAQNPSCHIVATTSYYNSTTEDKVTRRGFDAYLPKPLKLENIVSLIDNFGDNTS